MGVCMWDIKWFSRVRLFTVVIVLCFFVSLSYVHTAYASDVVKTKDIMTFNTTPKRVQVLVQDTRKRKIRGKCKTPCNLKLRTNTGYRIALMKVGFELKIIEIPDYSSWSKINNQVIELRNHKEFAKIEYDRFAKKCRLKREARRDDGDAKTCHRVPPIMPARAVRSGSCKMKFDVDDTGSPVNITAKCTESVFKKASINTVKRWMYLPKIMDGHPVTQTGVTTQIDFSLANEKGQHIPAKKMK